MTSSDTYDAEYFRRFTPRETGVLAELEKEAVEKDVPIVGPVVGKMLWLTAKIMKAERILELGTATGYSAIWMARALSETGGKLTTIEWDAETIERAKGNIAEAGYADTVEVLQGNAAEMLSSFEPDTFDMIFQDIDMEMYLELLDNCARVLKPGGLMFFDNTAFKTAGNFLENSLKHPDLDGVHLYAFLPEHAPDWDGLTLLTKK